MFQLSNLHAGKELIQVIMFQLSNLNAGKELIQVIMFQLSNLNASLAHKSENVYNLSDILIRDHDVRTYFTGQHSRGKILYFAGSGHRKILKLWGGSLLSRDP